MPLLRVCIVVAVLAATSVLLPACRASNVADTPPGDAPDRAGDTGNTGTTAADNVFRSDDHMYPPAFAANQVIDTAPAAANPFRIEHDPATLLTTRHYKTADLPPVWEDGHESLTDPGTHDDDPQPARPRPPTLADRASQLHALLHATIGDAAWQRPGTWIDLDSTGLTIRQTRTVLDTVDALFDALAPDSTPLMVAVRLQLVAVPPGAMSAFRTVSPLPGNGPPHALLDQIAANAFVALARSRFGNTDVTSPSIMMMAGQQATISVFSQRSYVAGFEAVEGAPAGTFDPVVDTDARGFLAALRAVPLPGARGHVLAFGLEMAARLPMLRYPLNGGELAAQLPRGGRVEVSGSATIPPGKVLMVVVPDTIGGGGGGSHDDDNDPGRLLLAFFSVQRAAVPDGNDRPH
ncbi:MAG: hypothetical protein AB7K09_12890 [Planctomycetota bacterium]